MLKQFLAAGTKAAEGGPAPHLEREGQGKIKSGEPAQAEGPRILAGRREIRMQTGKSLMELAQEVMAMQNSKRDFIAPTTKLEMTTAKASDGALVPMIQVEGNGTYDIGPVAHEQIGDRLGIPRKYYDRMKAEAPDLLARNVNTWFQKEPERRMIRTLSRPNAHPLFRSFHSDRFRPLDNDMILNAALPVLGEHGINVLSSQLTDRRMYLQVVSPKFEGEVKKGDVVQMGIIISNSEVGAGAVKVEPMLYRLVCLNGMIRGFAMKRYHVGKRADGSGDEVAIDYYKGDTQEATNRAFQLQVRDTVSAAFDQIRFNAELDKFREAAEQKIQGAKIQDVIEDVTRKFSLSGAEKDLALQRLIEGADLSKWGLANALTSLANDAPEYDRAVELERIGGNIIDLTPSEWNTWTARN